MSPRPNTPPLQSGDRFAGCTIERLVGQGGMASVYQARKDLLDLTVAVKVLHPWVAQNRELLSRFLREAKLAARLDHPAIIRATDVGEDRGLYYIVMDFVEGQDLRNVVREHGPIPARAALEITRRVASGLEFAHDRNVVHRDVKPANIIRLADGDVRIADFGLARPMHPGGEDSQVTMAGQILGTPVFMSPEQCRGDPADARSDLYSLGATLYMLLVGEAPFSADTSAALLHRILHEAPPSLRSRRPDLSPGVVAIVQRLMAKHPASRFQRGSELIAEIDRVLESPAEPAGAAQRTTTTTSRPAEAGNVSKAALAAVGVALLVAGWAAWASISGPPAAEAARSGRRPSRNGTEATTPSTGSGSSVRFTGTAPAPRPDVRSEPADADADRLEEDPVLLGRARRFRRALLGGSVPRALDFVDPELARKPRFRVILTSLMHALESREARCRRSTPERTAPSEALEYLQFLSARDALIGAVTVRWTLRGGVWYASPEFRVPGATTRRLRGH